MENSVKEKQLNWKNPVARAAEERITSPLRSLVPGNDSDVTAMTSLVNPTQTFANTLLFHAF